MSLAAKEMQAPPPALRHTKIALWLQGAGVVGYVFAVGYEQKEAATLIGTGIWLTHFFACAFIVRAARQMGRRWWRYMSWHLLMPIAGPLGSLIWLEHWRDSRT